MPRNFNNLIPYARGGRFQPQREIYHYVSRSLGLITQDSFNNLWFQYFIKTPFCNEKIFGNIFNAITNLTQSINHLWKNILKQSSKKKFFYIDPSLANFMIDLFNADVGDVIINSINPRSFENLIEMAKIHQNDRIFIIRDDNYKNICKELTDLGLIENENFFNADDFTFDNRNSYNIISKL